MQKNKKNYFRRIIEIATILCIVLIGAFIIEREIRSNVSNLITDLNCDELKSNWVAIYPDGHSEPAKMPSKRIVEKGEVMAVETILPDKLEPCCSISFRAKHQSVKVYIDGEERLSYGSSSDYFIVSKYQMVELKESDAGKILRIEGISNSSKTHIFSKVFIGEKGALIMNYLKRMGLEMFLSGAFLLIGLIALVWGSVLRIGTQGEIRIDYAGYIMILLAIWDATHSDFRDFIFKDPFVVSQIPTICLLFISICLAQYFDWLQGRRFTKVYRHFEVGMFIYIIVRIAMYAVGVVSFAFDTPIACLLLYTIDFMFLILYRIDRRRDKRADEYKPTIIGMYGLMLFGLVQMVRYYMTVERDSGVFLCAGYIVFLVSGFIHTQRIVLRMDGEKEAALLAADLKNQFIATMSHEIRTPINAILGMNEAISRESSEEVITGYSNDVDTAGKLLLSLVNDILDYSKLEAGKMELICEPYSVAEYLRFCYGIVSKKASEKGLTVNVKVNGKIPSLLVGDQIRLKQVLINILNNAVKYTEEGTVTLSAKYKERDDDRIDLILSVKDTGRGIRKEDIPKLFTAFSRIEEGENRTIEGTGMGLAIVSKYVELMGGDITVDSVYGKGSTFIITIPQEVKDWEPVREVSFDSVKEKLPEKKKEIIYAPGIKLLAVDDISLNLKVVNSLLKHSEIEIDNAKSGDECLEKVKNKKYDIILLDHMMPKKDGIETLKEMRAIENCVNENTPVIMMTANATTGAKEVYMSNGFAGYISKPFSSDDLKEMLIEQLPGRVSLKEVQTEKEKAPHHE